MVKRRNRFIHIIGALAAFTAMIIAMSFVVMLLWNWLIPDLFSGSEVTFIQAAGLLLLAKILTGFSGWRKHDWGGSHVMNHKQQYWKQRWEQKMANMTPEEREKFKHQYYDRCGWNKSWMKKEDGSGEEKNEMGHA